MNLVEVAAEEIFVNIARYAYPAEGGKACIRTEIEENPKGIKIEFSDSGIAFDPLEKADPDLTIPVSDKEIGGLGIFMARKMMVRKSF